jgi:hypothetical protein
MSNNTEIKRSRGAHLTYYPSFLFFLTTVNNNTVGYARTNDATMNECYNE